MTRLSSGVYIVFFELFRILLNLRQHIRMISLPSTFQ